MCISMASLDPSDLFVNASHSITPYRRLTMREQAGMPGELLALPRNLQILTLSSPVLTIHQ
jgi:hypothetical protein